MVLVHYKQASRLQKLLAKHHCPEFWDDNQGFQAALANTREVRRVEYLVRVNDDPNNKVKMINWLDTKRGWLEFSLTMRKAATCQGKTRHMEDNLGSCKDEATQIFPETIKCW